MEAFLNRLEISYCNINLCKNVNKKEVLLNKVLAMIKYYRLLMDFITYLHIFNPEDLQEFITKLNKPSLILLSYDLNAIGKAVKLSDDFLLTFHNNAFHVEYKPISPTSDSTHSLHSEWGY